MRQYVESRKSLLAKIHIAKKDIGLDDDAYRAMLESLTGKTSCRDLTDRQLTLVLGSLRRQGWQDSRPGKAGERPSCRPGCEALLRKIGALLADAGRPWAYAESMARRMYKVEALRWCGPDQMRGLVAALSNDAARRRTGAV